MVDFKKAAEISNKYIEKVREIYSRFNEEMKKEFGDDFYTEMVDDADYFRTMHMIAPLFRVDEFSTGAEPVDDKMHMYRDTVNGIDMYQVKDW